MSALSDSVVGAESTPAVTGVGDIPTGMSGESQAVQSKINDIMKLRAGDYGRAALMGAAAGGQAGQGQTNPLSAFIQGAAAGLQVPGQLYAQKQAQIQSTLDATPFVITHPDLGGKGMSYEELGGFPTALAMKVLQQAAIDTHKVLKESQARMAEERIKGEQARDTALFTASLKGKDPTDFKAQIEIGKSFQGLDSVAKYNAILQPYQSIMSSEKNAPVKADGTKNLAVSDKQMMVGFMRIVAPQIRVTEGSSQMLDASSGLDKATIGWWNKVANGQTLQPEERNAIKSAAIGEFSRVQKPYHDTLSFWSSNLAKNGGDPEMLTATKELKTVFDKNGVVHIGYVMPNGSFAEAQ